MDFLEVTKLLKPKEIENLLVAAYSSSDARPFVVENVRVLGGKKAVAIRYMATNTRRTIEVANA